MHQLSCYSTAGSSCPHIQAGPEASPPGTSAAAGAASTAGGAGPLPAAALRSSGPGTDTAELWVRWGRTADDWCCFALPGAGQRPSARCGCGYAGLGLLFCSHLAEAYRSYLAPAAGSSGGSSSTSPAVLDVSALEAACSQLSSAELAALLLATVLFTGAGNGILKALGLDSSKQQLAGAAAEAQHAMERMAAMAREAAEGCSLGSWPVAGGVGGGVTPLLDHAASLLAPATAEGMWEAVASRDNIAGVPVHLRPAVVATAGKLNGQELLQAALLLQSSGHGECSRHLLQEYLIALSHPALWRACEPAPRGLLHRLWDDLLPPVERLAWWEQQQGRASQRLCSGEYLDLLSKLLGPVAVLQHIQAVLGAADRQTDLELAASVLKSQSARERLYSSLTNVRSALQHWLGLERTAPSIHTRGTERQQLVDRLTKAWSAHPHGAMRPAAGGSKQSGPGGSGTSGGGSGEAAQPATLLLTAARTTTQQLLELPLAEAVLLHDRLIPDLQELVMAEAAALQLRHLQSQSQLSAAMLLEAVQQQQAQEQERQRQRAAASFRGPALPARRPRGLRTQPLPPPQQQRSSDVSVATLLRAAASGDVSQHGTALRMAACALMIDLIKPGHGMTKPYAVVWQLSQALADGSGWVNLAQLLDSCQQDPIIPGCGTLPAALAAWQQLLSAAREEEEGSQQWQAGKGQTSAKPKKKGGTGKQQGQQTQEPKAARKLLAWVPALCIELLAARLPGCLQACCAAVAAALEARKVPSAADAGCDALHLALSGVLSCCQLATECARAAALSPEHAAAAAALQRGLQPHPLLTMLPVLLEAAQAATSQMAELERRAATRILNPSQLAGTLRWMEPIDALATALLDPLLRPSPFESAPVATGSDAAGTSAAVAAAAGSGPCSLLAALPQLLATSAVVQHTKCPAVRGRFLVLLCRCLVAVSGAAEAPTAAQQSAQEALVQLLLSPAVEVCLQPAALHTEQGRQTAAGLFGAAVHAGTAAGPGTASRPELGRLAYLAVNALASHAQSSWSPAAALVHKEVPKASVERAVEELKAHSVWQCSALWLLSLWLSAAQLEELLAAEGAAETDASSGGSIRIDGPPSLTFVVSTLAAMLTMARASNILKEVAQLLCEVPAAHPLLLQCSSLPLLVRAAATRQYQTHSESTAMQRAGSSGAPSKHVATNAASLQRKVEELLSCVQQAGAGAGAAGAVALATWQLWEERPPAGLMNSSGQEAVPAARATASSGAAAPWDRLAASAAAVRARHTAAGGPAMADMVELSDGSGLVQQACGGAQLG
ncbi:hypothetical protein ABPG75_000822 [Micractinium tetrahymenae]